MEVGTKAKKPEPSVSVDGSTGGGDVRGAEPSPSSRGSNTGRQSLRSSRYGSAGILGGLPPRKDSKSASASAASSSTTRTQVNPSSVRNGPSKSGMRNVKAAMFSSGESSENCGGNSNQEIRAADRRIARKGRRKTPVGTRDESTSQTYDDSNNQDDTDDPTGLADVVSPGAYHIGERISRDESSSEEDLPSIVSGEDLSAGEKIGDIELDIDGSMLKRAREVADDDEKHDVLDDIERRNVFERAKKEAEEKLMGKTAQATEELNEEQKRRRRILCGVGICVLLAAIAGSVTGGLVAGLDRGSTSSSSVQAPPTPAPSPFVPFDEELDICTGAQDVTHLKGMTILGSTKGASVNNYDTCDVIERNGRGIFYKVQGDGKTKIASTCNNTYFDTQVSIFTGDCDRLQCVAGNDQIGCGNGDQSIVAWHSEPDKEYYIHIHGHRRTSQGVFELLFDDLKDNDKCMDATDVIFNSELPIFGSTRNTMIDDIEDCGTANQVSGGVWYTVTRVNGQMIAFAETGGLTSFRSQISVYEGRDCDNLACVTGKVSETAEWTGESGKRYFVLVHGLGAQEGDFQFRVLSELVIIEPPQDDDGLLACDMAGEIPVGSMGRGDTFFGPVSDAESCGRDVFATAQGKWFTTTGTGGAMITSTCDTTTGFDTQISVYRGENCNSLECVDGNDQSCGDRSTVVWFSDPGVTYYILVHGTTGRTGEFNITVDDEETLGEPIVVTSPTCNGAVGLSVDNIATLGSFDNAGSPEVGDCAGIIDGDPGVWYEVEGSGTFMTVSTCDGAATVPLRLLVFEETCESLVCVNGAFP